MLCKTLHLDAPLPRVQRAGLEQLRVLNAQTHPEPHPHRGPGQPGRLEPFPEFPRHARITGSVYRGAPDGVRTSLRIRPALNSFSDPWIGRRPVNALEALSLEVSCRTDGSGLRLEEFILFRQFSLPPSSWISERTSWMIDVSSRRGDLFDDATLLGGIGAGVGRTRLLLSHVYLYALATASLQLSGGGEVASAPGLLIGTALLPSPNWRAGASWRCEQDVLDRSRSQAEFGAWLRRDLGRGGGLNTGVTRRARGWILSMAVDWYPFRR